MSSHFIQTLIELGLLTTVISWCVCWCLVRGWLFQSYINDQAAQDVQAFHTIPTPRLGGLALAVALLAALGVEWFRFVEGEYRGLHFAWLMAAAVPCFIGGLTEDMTRRVGSTQRLLLAIISAALFIGLGHVTITRMGITWFDTALTCLPFAIVFTIFCVAGVVNAINMIDCYNGLASGMVVIALLAIITVALKVQDGLVLIISVSTLGASLGFIVWNWPKGRLFLGDGGAYLLGFLLAELSVLLVYRNPNVSPWFPLLLLSYPVYETLFSMYRRRWVHKSKLCEPDNRHLHQLIFDRIALNSESRHRKALNDKGEDELCERSPIERTGKSSALCRKLFLVGEINGCDYATRCADQILMDNSRVAPYLWGANALIAICAIMFWQSTVVLIVIAAWVCVAYVVLYLRLSMNRRPDNA